MANQSYPSFEQVQEARKQFRDVDWSHWVNHDIHTFNIWFLLVIAIVPWIIWFRVVDRSRIYEFLTLGLFLGLTSTILDSIGTNLLL